MKFFANSSILCRLNKYFNRNVKDKSPHILRLWTNQCEYVSLFKLRRVQQAFFLYARIWEEHALKELLKRLRGQVQRSARGFLLSSSVLLAAFDWDKERIGYETVREQFDEFDYLAKLKRETIFCKKCQRRKLINDKIDGVVYCSCTISAADAMKECNTEFSKWEPYIEQKDMITWRSEVSPGLYAYKVYVHYEDITAEDFLHVQTDVEYRKQWDNTALSLEVIDQDPAKGSNSQVIYWEMLWPKLFANRDYVYNRRFFVDKARRVIVIVNKSINHPKCPQKPKNQRVDEYWSFMVIKPKTTFSKPGVEFVLTYFDNPGLSIPKYITTWVAQRQMPDFLTKLHRATLDYAAVKQQSEHRIIDYWDNLKDPGFEYPPEFNITSQGDDYDENPDKEDDVELQKVEKSGLSSDSSDDEDSGVDVSDEGSDVLVDDNSIFKVEIVESNKKEQDETEIINANEQGRTSLWGYLHPYSYSV